VVGVGVSESVVEPPIGNVMAIHRIFKGNTNLSPDDEKARPERTIMLVAVLHEVDLDGPVALFAPPVAVTID
jgi:hypothetical protein